MMPTVRGVIAASIAAGSMVKVEPSVSQNTGVAPEWVIIAEVEIQECAVATTSSPGSTLSGGEREIDRIGAVGARDIVLDIDRADELAFERFDIGPANASLDFHPLQPCTGLVFENVSRAGMPGHFRTIQDVDIARMRAAPLALA
jgi:hypothetical protein